MVKTMLLPSLDSATSHRATEGFLEGCHWQKHIHSVFLILQPCVLPLAVKFMSCVPIGIHGLLVQLKGGLCPCPQEPPTISEPKSKFVFV